MIYDYTIQYSFQDQHEKIYQTTYSYIIKLMAIVFFHLSCLSKLPLRREQWNHIVLQSRGILVVLCFFMEGRFEKKKQNEPTLFNWKSHFEWQVSVFHNSRQMKLNLPFTNRLFAFVSLKLLLWRWLYPGCQFSTYTRCSKDWVWTYHTWERFTKRFCGLLVTLSNSVQFFILFCVPK